MEDLFLLDALQDNIEDISPSQNKEEDVLSLGKGMTECNYCMTRTELLSVAKSKEHYHSFLYDKFLIKFRMVVEF